MCTAISTVCTNVGVYTLYVHGYSKFMSNSDHNNWKNIKNNIAIIKTENTIFSP